MQVSALVLRMRLGRHTALATAPRGPVLDLTEVSGPVSLLARMNRRSRSGDNGGLR
jgi:hypothetical protein